MRYKTLDHWRGLACLLVIVFHVMGPESGGLVGRLWIGVPLFFVISGYCIAASAESTLQHGRPLREYFWRRLKRIFPPYWAALILCGLLAISLPLQSQSVRGLVPLNDPRALTSWQWLGSLSLSAGWLRHVPVFWRGAEGWWLQQAWTLGYEEQFYLVTGALLVLGAHWWRGAVLVSGLVALLVLTGLHTAAQGVFLDGRWLLFAFGLGVYRHRQIGGWAVPLTFAVSLAWALTHLGSHLVSEMIVATAFAGLLLIIAPFDERFAESRTLRPLQWCGLRCYSIYLLHWPIVRLLVAGTAGWSRPALLSVAVPLGMGLSLLAAMPFHAVIERRCMTVQRLSAE